MLKLDFKKIVSIGLTTAIFVAAFTSLSIDTLAYATCTDTLKKDLNDQLERVSSISNGKTDKQNNDEIKNNNRAKSNQKYGQFDYIIDIVKPLVLGEISKEYVMYTESSLLFSDLNQSGDLFSGKVEENRQYNYSDGSNGFSVNKYTFEYNQSLKKLTLLRVNEQTINNEKYVEPNLSEAQKRDISSKKELNKSINDKVKPTKEQDIFELAKNRSVKYEEQKTLLKNQIKNAGCILQTKANYGDQYDRYATRDYALNWALSRNSNFNNYGQEDCTNFASQTQYAGHMTMSGYPLYTDNYSWYSYKNIYGGFNSVTVSQTFRSVNSFMIHMYNYENTGPWLYFSNSGYSIFDPLLTGDILIAGDANGWQHAMTITGWDSINNHWEPRLSYHSNDNRDLPFAQFRSREPNSVYVGLQVYSGTVY